MTNQTANDFGRLWDGYRDWGLADLRAAADLIAVELERLETKMEEATRKHKDLEDQRDLRGFDIEGQMEAQRQALLHSRDRALMLRERHRIVEALIWHKIQQPADDILAWGQLSKEKQEELQVDTLIGIEHLIVSHNIISRNPQFVDYEEFKAEAREHRAAKGTDYGRAIIATLRNQVKKHKGGQAWRDYGDFAEWVKREYGKIPKDQLNKSKYLVE